MIADVLTAIWAIGGTIIWFWFFIKIINNDKKITDEHNTQQPPTDK
jgi:hypothetical protein